MINQLSSQRYDLFNFYSSAVVVYGLDFSFYFRLRLIFTARQHSMSIPVACYAERCISYSKSVRLSVRLSHASFGTKINMDLPIVPIPNQ